MPTDTVRPVRGQRRAGLHRVNGSNEASPLRPCERHQRSIRSSARHRDEIFVIERDIGGLGSITVHQRVGRQLHVFAEALTDRLGCLRLVVE